MNSDSLYTQQYFGTFDLGLSSALVTAGFLLDHLDKTHPEKVKFIFIREENQDEIIQSYWNGSLKISALAYFNNIKVLKNRIYSE